MFCEHCGTKIEKDAQFCQSCGKSISEGPKAATVSISTTPIRRMKNKLLCKITTWSWVISLILVLLMVFVGDGFETFFGGAMLIGGFMILVFGIWGLIRLSKAKRKIATIIVVCTILVLVFQKVELIYNLSIIGLFISTIMGLAELNKLPDVEQ